MVHLQENLKWDNNSFLPIIERNPQDYMDMFKLDYAILSVIKVSITRVSLKIIHNC